MVRFPNVSRLRVSLPLIACCLPLTAPSLPMMDIAPQVRADIIDDVPGEAWAAIVIRDLNGLDRKVMNTLQQLQMPPMSVVGFAKGHLQLTGVKDSGSAAIVMMPVANIMAPQEGIAVLVPTEDYNGLLQSLSPEDLGDGTSKVRVANEESYAASFKGYAVLSENPGAVKAMIAAKNNPGVRSKWTRHQQERFSADDLTIYLNLEAIIGSPGVQGMLGMMAAMPNGQMMLEQWNSMRAVAVGLRMDKSGINLGIYSSSKPGSKTAQIAATMPSTKESLLTGLPADNYVMAVGMTGSKETWTAFAEQMGASFNNPMLAMQMQLDPAKLSQLAGLFTEMSKSTRSVSVAVSSLPAGEDGLMGVTKIIGVEGDAAKSCERVAEMVQLVTSGLATNPNAKSAMDNVAYKAAAETINGVQVDQVTVALDKIPGVDARWVQSMQKILGRGGITVRLAAVDDKRIAMSFGGGKARMEQAIALTKAGNAPLSGDASVRKSAGMLPTKRNFEGYIAADSLMKMVNSIAIAVDESPVPSFPSVGIPAGMVGGPVGDAGYQFDLALPIELVVAIKDYVLAAQMSQGGTAGG